MEQNEHTLKFNTIAEQLGLDYRMGDIVVALKEDRGNISIARSFECSHIIGNYEKYNKEKHKILGF